MTQTDRSAWLRGLLRALTFLRPHRWAVGLILILILVGAIANAVHPLVHKYIFDGLTQQADWPALLLGLGFLLGLGLIGELVGGLSNWLTWRTRLRVNEDLLDRTIGRLYELPLTFHRDETVGGLMTRTERGINGFLSALTDVAFGILPAVAYLGIATFFMVRLEWRLSLIVLGGAVTIAFVTAWAAAPQTRRDRVMLERWARINGRFNEALSGILTLKSLVAEDPERRRFLRNASRNNRIVLRGVGFDTSISFIKNTGAILARVAALGMGAWLVLRGEITIGTLVAFIGYAGGIFGPLFALTGTYSSLRRASVSLDAIFHILDQPVRTGMGTRPSAPLRGAVRFEGVSFAYGGARAVLEDLSFTAEPGEHIALVGPSGAGKTTIVALIQGFYPPTAGHILMDGQDLAKLDEQWVRRQIGVVLQESFLFDDTIANNLLLARPTASRSEVEDAARLAQADSFIRRLPRGYDTRVGERGALLSGGQRQRIAIARALLKDPPILILDEATSALDPESQAAIREGLPILAQGRTTFIISHRLSMVGDADRILVLKAGRLVEQGTHPELIASDGSYARMVRLQSTGSLRTGGAERSTAGRSAD